MDFLTGFQWAIVVVLLLYSVIVSAYSDFTQPKGTAIIRDTTESIGDLLSHRIAVDIDRLHEYAALSAACYEGTDYTVIVKDSSSLADLWELVLDEHTRFMITSSEESKVKSFNYEVYRRRDQSESGKIVYAIVFRGTDGFLDDLASNLHWMSRWIPCIRDQYDFVRENTSNIIQKIHAHSKSSADAVEIIAAGHSLGGGLAQQAAYAADGIETVFAFAPSSVTGYFDVNKAARKRREQRLRIYRIHERGEVLAYLRRFMKTIYPVVSVNPKIVEIRLAFQKKSLHIIGLHGIGPLATAMISEWEAQSRNLSVDPHKRTAK